MDKKKYLRSSSSFILDKTLPKKSNNKLSRQSIATIEHNKQNATDKLYETLMNDPIKRALVLQILSQEKPNIEAYKKREAEKEKPKTPLKKLKKKAIYESPTSLFRRKQLEHNEQKGSNSDTALESENVITLKVPYEELLKGLVVYVEIRSKGEDKSKVAKTLVQSMGAEVKDEFTKDVTHVIFKDGSYVTYQRAKLKKVFLVSVLWLEAVRKNRVRVPEKEYPALSIDRSNGDMSLICEQMQKEYEEIVRDEYNRSLHKNTFNTPVKSTRQSRSIISPTNVNSLDNCDALSDSSNDSNEVIINGSFTKSLTTPVIDDLPKSNSNDTTPSFSLMDQTKKSTGKKQKKFSETNNDEQEMDLTSVANEGENISKDTIDKSKEISKNSTDNISLRLSSTDASTNISRETRSKNSNSTNRDSTNQHLKNPCVIIDSEMSSLRLSTSCEKNSKTSLSTNQNSTKSNGTSLSANDKFSSRVDESDLRHSPSKAKINVVARRSVRIKNIDKVLQENNDDDDVDQTTNYNGKRLVDTECSPEKYIKIGGNDAFVTMRRSNKKQSKENENQANKTKADPKKANPNKRRLFDLNQTPDFNNEDDCVPLPSVLLTPSAKKYLENKTLPPNKQTKSNDKQAMKSCTLVAEKNVTSNGKFKVPSTGQRDLHKTKPFPATPTRKSMRISQIVQEKCNDVVITPINRRSTLDFVQISEMNKKKMTQTSKRVSTIVCTRLHNADVQIFEQIVKKLGSFVIEDEVSARTSHLVAGECRRTVNILRAIARGCWIVKHEWLLKSLEESKWLPEEDYELTEFSPAVQQCRKERQAFGTSYSSDIFLDLGYIYVAKSSTPRCSDLKELIQLCKGKVATTFRNASIIVGEVIQQENVVCVKETWILDSITYNKCKSFKHYLLKSPVQI